MRRFFVEDIREDSPYAEIKGGELRHLNTVLRLRSGDAVVLFNGHGLEFEGNIESLGKNSAGVRVARRLGCLAESPVDITLLQGYVKGDKPEFVVQKATELGVKDIVFYSASRTVAKFMDEEKKISRLRKVSIEALKQSGRGFLPGISFMPFENAVKGWKDRLRLVLYEGEERRHIKDLIKGRKAVVVMVGPEGGFSEDEVKEAGKEGFIPAGLGPRILRAETAAVAVLSIIQYEMGDMG